MSAAEVAVTGEVRVVTLSRLLELFPPGKPVEPRPSSWSTYMSDIEAGNPYPLWKSKDNPIHQLQWQHLRIAFELAGKAAEVAFTEQAKYYADIAEACWIALCTVTSFGGLAGSRCGT